MRHFFSFGTLESRIYTIFTVMIFGAIFIMQLVAFRYTEKTVKSTAIESNRVILHQLVSQIDSYIQGMEQISDALTGSREVLDWLAFRGGISGDMPPGGIQERLRHYIQAREDISEILLVRTDRQILTSDPEARINPWTALQDKPWFSRAAEAGGRTTVSSSYVQNLLWGRYSWVVSLSRGILDASGRLLGVLLVDLKFNRISSLCQSLIIGKRGYNFILDSKGNYVFHPTQQLVYSNIRTEPLEEVLGMASGTGESLYYLDGRYYMTEHSPLTGWYVVSVLYESDIITEWKSIQLIYTLIALVLFLVVGLVTHKVSSGITKPVRRLQEIMGRVETGDFPLVGELEGTDEIRDLARDYDIMVGRIRELMAANVKEQEQKRKSDLKALQAQINPHFLYNTLDSIIWMGEMGQCKEVVQMTSALSKLFRISISKGRELIPIRSELEHVRSYLIIQEMRYKDKFRYEMDVDPRILDLYTLKITLQPLVENAIYHGIKEAEHPCCLGISGWLEEDVVHLEVKDDGVGMDEKALSVIRERLKEGGGRPGRGGHGVGIHNVHERIRLYFGKDYGLSCHSSLSRGTVMLVRFPLLDMGDAS